jgi:pimeloyl-ACP methyl ester carboxylesterase
MAAAQRFPFPMLDIRTSQLRTRDGLRLAFRRYAPRQARGLPAVCLPEPPGNGRDFAGLALALAARRPVLCPDPRGCGQSERDRISANYGPRVAAADLLDVLDHAAPGPVLGLAEGLAGFALLHAVAARPGRFAGVVLSDVGPELAPDGTARLLREAAALRPVRGPDEAAALLHPGGAPAHVDLRARVLARFREGPDGRLVPDSDRALRLRLARWCDAQARAAAGTLPPELPVLLVHGAASDVLPAEALAAWRATGPQLATFRVPGRGHEPLLDAPEARRAIDGFLACLD